MTPLIPALGRIRCVFFSDRGILGYHLHGIHPAFAKDSWGEQETPVWQRLSLGLPLPLARSWPVCTDCIWEMPMVYCLSAVLRGFIIRGNTTLTFLLPLQLLVEPLPSPQQRRRHPKSHTVTCSL